MFTTLVTLQQIFIPQLHSSLLMEAKPRWASGHVKQSDYSSA